jgi:hypothetical protein
VINCCHFSRLLSGIIAIIICSLKYIRRLEINAYFSNPAVSTAWSIQVYKKVASTAPQIQKLNL